jgi:hypothetical protein
MVLSSREGEWREWVTRELRERDLEVFLRAEQVRVRALVEQRAHVVEVLREPGVDDRRARMRRGARWWARSRSVGGNVSAVSVDSAADSSRLLHGRSQMLAMISSGMIATACWPSRPSLVSMSP